MRGSLYFRPADTCNFAKRDASPFLQPSEINSVDALPFSFGTLLYESQPNLDPLQLELPAIFIIGPVDKFLFTDWLGGGNPPLFSLLFLA